MKPKYKANQKLLIAYLCIMLAACSFHENTDQKNPLSDVCNSNSNANICANWNLKETTCSGSRTDYLLYQYESYAINSAETYKKQVELLTSLHTCLKKNYLKLPVFKTSEKLLMQKEIILAQETCNKIKSKLRKVSKKRLEVGVGMIRKETNRCFI